MDKGGGEREGGGGANGKIYGFDQMEQTQQEEMVCVCVCVTPWAIAKTPVGVWRNLEVARVLNQGFKWEFRPYEMLSN